MLKEELSGGGNSTGDTWARVCDTCRSSPSRVYCRADAAYLCVACDARVHAAAAAEHERVWVCEACERAPAAFMCKADAASLCGDCDAKVHSANPLARRHQRFPILPLSGCLYGPSATNPGRKALASVLAAGETEDGFDEDEDEAASWLLLNPSNNTNTNTNNNNAKEINSNNTNGCSLGGEVVDDYLDLVEFDLGGENARLKDETYNHQGTQQSHHENHQYAVPVGVEEGNNGMHDHHHHHHHIFHMGLDYNMKSHHYGYNNNDNYSIAHSVSVSSLDVGIVPESTTSDISTSHARTPKGTIELFSNPPLQQMATQLSPMDREARVLRYREKKKTRKFEKTIRYASRKAYAEKRPRIKGRFAKRIDTEVEVEQMFPNTVMVDAGYGIVPSF